MLLLNTRVPAALILPEPVSDLHAHLVAQGAHWFRARPDDVVTNDTPGSIDALLSCTSALRAGHTNPNTHNTFFSTERDDPGLAFKAGLHCGYTVPDIVPDARSWSAAVRFAAPGGDARTLLTLNTDALDNYMFLQQTTAGVLFKDQQNTLECHGDTVTATAGPDVYVVGLSDNQLWLKMNDGALLVSQKNARLDLSGALTLFIGCRDNKGRLHKKLGTFQLHDVIVWPDQNVLDPAHKTTQTALENPALWRVSQ